MKTKILTTAIFLLISPLIFAQTQGKHPRVAELEADLTKQAIDLLRARFPDKPFLVTVNVDPMHRYGDSGPTARPNNDEKLPLSWYDDEEIRDEWDDPKMPMKALLARVKKALVNVSIPMATSDDEIVEIQQSLISALGLVPARDEVKIFRRTWGQNVTKYDPVWIGLGISCLIVALLSLYAISKMNASKLAKAIEDSATKQNSGSAGVRAPSLSNLANEQSTKSVGNGSDLRFNDPLKTREVVHQTIDSLFQQHRKVFPTLEDMLLLDRFGELNPSALGALVLEFPADQQRLLFSYSYKMHWLVGLNEPGEIGSASIDVLQKLIRNARHEGTPEWEQLLISFWRLDEERVAFIRSLDQDEALAILVRMPKSLSVGIARKAFPGSWGTVLNSTFQPKEISQKRIVQITEQAKSKVALRDYSMLDRFKQEKDLLEYLKFTDPNEERDIYAVTPPGSLIHSLRPAFYKVLELDETLLKEILPHTKFEDWALAMFNLPKPDRRKVELSMGEKQRFLYFERLKQLDSSNPSALQVGLAREKMAVLTTKLQSQLSENKNNEDQASEESNVVEKQAA